MNDVKNKMIFLKRREIERSKSSGYTFEQKKVHGKLVGWIKNKSLKVNFYIDDVAMADLVDRWHHSKLTRYIGFADWILGEHIA